MNKKLIEMSLLGSSSALGLNWIYDADLMKEFSKNNNVLFLPIQHKLHKKAEKGFDVYPNHNVGDLDFMGEVLFQFHRFLLKGGNAPKEFRKVLFESFGPDSVYDGYIEKYGKALLSNISNISYESPEIDKQLIGPSMFIIGHAHNLNKNQILEYTKVLTTYDKIPSFHKSLDYIFTNLTSKNKEAVLEQGATLLDETYQQAVLHSFSDIDVDEFITKYSGIACGLEQSYGLIYYIVIHTSTFKEALTLNTSLGGASSARGLLIGAIYSYLEDVPEEFVDVLNVLL